MMGLMGFLKAQVMWKLIRRLIVTDASGLASCHSGQMRYDGCIRLTVCARPATKHQQDNTDYELFHLAEGPDLDRYVNYSIPALIGWH